MRLGIRAAALLGLVAIAGASPPAHAAQSAGFAFSAVSGVGVTRTHFIRVDKCGGNPSASPVKGVDAAILNVSSYPAGYTLTIGWSGQVGPSGTLVASFYTSGCDRVLPLATSGGASPSVPYRVKVPPGVKWLIVDGSMVANVALTVS